MEDDHVTKTKLLSGKIKLELFFFGLGLGIIATGIVLGSSFIYSYRHKFYPGVHIDNILVAGLNKEEAKNLLSSKSESLDNYQVSVRVEDISIASSSGQIGVRRDYSDALNNAFAFSRDRNFLYKLYSIWRSQEQKPNFSSQLKIDEKKTQAMLTKLANKVNTKHSLPSAELKSSGSASSLIINKGKVGRKLLVSETLEKLKNNIKAESFQLEGQTTQLGSELSPEQLVDAKKRAQKIVNLFVELQGEDTSRQISDQELIRLLAFPQGLDEKKLEDKLQTLAKEINRRATDAVFDFDEKTLKVSSFQPSRDGLELDLTKTKEQLKNIVEKIDQQDCKAENCINSSPVFSVEELQANKSSPSVSLKSTNNLGINELIGFGDSHYAHSIPNRIHNVAHASKLINNTIIAPGEEFSLVKTLGEVSKRTGFKSAYIISGGATVLGDGGGVCQVSTTVFRSALDAGLSITRRLPHSYRVSYYELNSKPGVDATVYSGNIDLRFINDTPGYILLHNETDSENLYMKVEIYGSSDGRSTEITNHKTYGFSSPPATEYIPSPDLPSGVTRRIENAIPGVKAEFTHVIRDENNNIISEKKYFSNYRAWGAKYLVGI